MTCWNLSYMPFNILKATDFLMAGNGLSLGFAQWLITSHILFVAPPLSSQEISLYSAEKGQSGTETVQLYGCRKVECGDLIVTEMFCWLILRTWLYRTQLDKLQQIHMMWINTWSLSSFWGCFCMPWHCALPAPSLSGGCPSLTELRLCRFDRRDCIDVLLAWQLVIGIVLWCKSVFAIQPDVSPECAVEKH